jgi:cytidylate kinase
LHGDRRNRLTFPKTIAIDGGAGSGKSTLGAMLADKLGYTFVDAGVIYRALTVEALNQACDVHDQAQIAELAQGFVAGLSGRQVYEQIVTGSNQTGSLLYGEAVNRNVPIVAAYPEVRAAVRQVQAELAKQGTVVFAGRDIGTVVLPNADLKFFLQVSLEVRIQRRYESLSQRDASLTRAQVQQDLLNRDRLDTERHESPLRPAEDAVIINTDNLTIGAALSAMLEMCDLGER